MMAWLALLAGIVPFGLVLAISIPLWIWVLRIMRPGYVYGRPSRSVLWLGRLRTLGLFSTAAVYLVYLGITTDVAVRAASISVQDGMRGLPAVLLGMLVVVFAARGARRRAALTALRRPLAAVLILVVFAAAVIVLVNTFDPAQFPEAPDEEEATWQSVIWLLKAGSVLATGVSFIPLTVLVSYLGVRHWCRATDGHPMLPAIITAIYAVMNIGWYIYDGLTPGMPAVIDRLIALGGPVALIIMSVVEFVILRRQGVSLAGPPAVHDLIGLNIAKKGHMAGELSEQAVRDNWNSVCSLYKYLAAGGNLLPLPTEGIRLRPGEQLYSRNVLGYARYYGTTVPYERSNHFWFGSTTFVVAGLAADSISNAVARSRAEAMAATQWRDHGHVQTILTSQRFLCDYRGQWLSFWHEGVVELVVDVPRWAFIVRYEEGAPLLLHGPAAPWFALAAARVIYGPQAYAWPAFASIAQAATNRTDAISEGLTNPDNTTQSPLA